MAVKLGDWFEDLNTSGIIAGIGAIVLAPIVIPVVAKASKPIAKALIKGGILAYDKSKTLIAETGEILEDLVAEVQAELASEQEQDNLE
jgi:hypothetical protein